MFHVMGAPEVVPDGVTYKSFEELFAELKTRMSNEGYKVVKSRTHRNKLGGSYQKGGEIVRCDLVCDRGGQPYKCQATRLKTSTKKTDCPWRAKAVNRKTIGAWVLTVICDQHNHEPRTPEPPSDAEHEADPEVEVEKEPEPPIPDAQDGQEQSAPDPSTVTSLALAGVSTTLLRLTGDTFHNFKTEYRKMGKHERLNLLAQMQLRIAAIYAVENEDVQRHQRSVQQEKRHAHQVEENRRTLQLEAQRTQQSPHIAAAPRIAAQPGLTRPGQPVMAQQQPPPQQQIQQAVQPVQQLSQQQMNHSHSQSMNPQLNQQLNQQMGQQVPQVHQVPSQLQPPPQMQMSVQQTPVPVPQMPNTLPNQANQRVFAQFQPGPPPHQAAPTASPARRRGRPTANRS